MLDELLGAQLDAADSAAPPMDESCRRAAAHGSTLVRPKPYDVRYNIRERTDLELQVPGGVLKSSRKDLASLATVRIPFRT
eukprot:scaffold60730_cov75-Phaeocystis_antarctica.AAC.2